MDLAEAQRVLGVDATASVTQLKTAYRTALKVWHPDRALGDPIATRESHARTQRLNAAYRLLTCDAQRSARADAPPGAGWRARPIRTIESDSWPARAIASKDAPVSAGLLVFTLGWAAMVGVALALEAAGLR